MSLYPADYVTWPREQPDAYFEEIKAKRQRKNSPFIETRLAARSHVPNLAAHAQAEALPLAPPTTSGQPYLDVAREAATIRDDALLAYATRKAVTYARAFAGAAKEMLLPNEGSAR